MIANISQGETYTITAVEFCRIYVWKTGRYNLLYSPFRVIYTVPQGENTKTEEHHHDDQRSNACDQMTDALIKNGINVEEVMIYSTSVMIDSLEKGKVIVLPDCWTDFHPHSKMVHYIRDYKLPYGFFLSKTASPAARKFLHHVSQSCS